MLAANAAGATDPRFITIPEPTPTPAPLDEPTQKSDPQQVKPEERGTEQIPLVVKAIPSEPTPQQKEQEKEKSNQDRRLSDYTEFLFFATCFLGLATAGLATVAFFQMRDARRAIGAAEDSAKAAKVSVDAEMAMQRAFIAVEPGGIRPYGLPDNRIACDILITNAGNLPARNVKWLIERKYSDDPAEKDFPKELAKLAGDIVIAPKGSARKGGNPTDTVTFDKHRTAAQPDRAWLYVWGRVAYHDGFASGRYIDFCHRYNLRGEVGYLIDIEKARYHEWGNHTDEA